MSIKTTPRSLPTKHGNCRECHGSGTVGMYQDRCTNCNGTGYDPVIQPEETKNWNRGEDY